MNIKSDFLSITYDEQIRIISEQINQCSYPLDITEAMNILFTLKDISTMNLSKSQLLKVNSLEKRLLDILTWWTNSQLSQSI